MPRPIWFRSLYWRIALGFVAMLAALLLVQGMLFLWLTGRFALSTASRTPQQLVDQVARRPPRHQQAGRAAAGIRRAPAAPAAHGAGRWTRAR